MFDVINSETKEVIGTIGLCMKGPITPCPGCGKKEPLMYAIFYKDGTRSENTVCNWCLIKGSPGK